jgi:hypothetical protein
MPNWAPVVFQKKRSSGKVARINFSLGIIEDADIDAGFALLGRS